MKLVVTAALFGALALLAAAELPGPLAPLALVPGALAALFLLEAWADRRDRDRTVLAVLAAAPLGLALVAGAAAVPGLVHAAEAAPHTVGGLFSDLRPTIEALLGAVATGVVLLVAWLYKRLTGAELDERMRRALQSALENGVHAGLDAVQGMVEARPAAVRSAVINQAIGYVKAFSPGVVRHFGLTDDRLADLLRAQLARLVPSDAATDALAKLAPPPPRA